MYLSLYFLKEVLYLDQEGLLRFPSHESPTVTYSVSGLALSASSASVTFTAPPHRRKQNPQNFTGEPIKLFIFQ